MGKTFCGLTDLLPRALHELQDANDRSEKATDLTAFLWLTAELAEGDGCPEEAAQLRLAADRMVELEAEAKGLRTAMTAVASMPGRDWLSGQCALGEALEGGGLVLDYVLQQAAEAAESEKP